METPPCLPKPVTLDSSDLLRELTLRCSRSRNRDAQELATILNRPHIISLFSSHDEVADLVENPNQNLLPKKTDNTPKLFPSGMTGEEIRMVGVRKKKGEPLGLTVEVDDNENLVIARIMEGGMIDKQGLLNVGDVILEVNGVEVNTPEDLQTEVAKSRDSVTLKVGNGNVPETHSSLVMPNGTTNKEIKKLTVSSFKNQNFAKFIVLINYLTVLHEGAVRIRPSRRHFTALQRNRPGLRSRRYPPNRRQV